ncbi:hypothetical protein JCM8097_003178 [Rhodosporidiobolus ruineniae]
MRSRGSSSTLFALSTLALLLPPPAHATYTLQHSYAGSSFFRGWEWFGADDVLTHGSTYYVPQSESSKLAYLNEAGNVVLKVDNSTTLSSGQNRNSVRITSNATYDIGSLVVFDALHLPYGCSTWPSFWMHALSWPSGGEIDIFEGVNLQSTNQVAVHSVAGCYANTTSLTQTGELTFGNCDYTVEANRGCTYVDPRNASYGAEFAAGGGGVFAAQLASEGISVWFFPRAQVPSDLASNSSSPDPSTWGLPVAYYPESSCAINQFFAPQQLTLNIALCGDWAGQPGVFSPTCGTGTCADYILDPSNLATAYFEIASIRVYNDPSLDTRGTGTQVAAASGIVGALGASRTGTSGARGRCEAGAGGIALAAAAGLAAFLA